MEAILRGFAELFDESNDWKGLAPLAFQLDPALLPSWSVWRVSSHSDDPFNTAPTGLRENRFSIGLNVLDKVNVSGASFNSRCGICFLST